MKGGRTDLAQCNKCGLNFLNEEGLGKHTKRVHEDKEQIKPSKYKCDRCAEEFLVKDDFKKHKLPEELSCELCEKKGEVSVLSTKCEYNFHIITHRIGKPKICDNCGSEFKNNKTLQNHKEQDKTVSCRRCNKIFTGSCPLQRHIKYEHDTKNEPIPPLQRQYARQQYSTGRSFPSKVVIKQTEAKQEEVKSVVTEPEMKKVQVSKEHEIKPNQSKTEVENDAYALREGEVDVKEEPEEIVELPPAKKPRTGLPALKLKTVDSLKPNPSVDPSRSDTQELFAPPVETQFFIPPEFMSGLCAHETILGL